MLPRLNMIGAGRVGQVLAKLWHTQGAVQVQDVLTTSYPTAQAACAFIGAGTALASMQAMRPAELWMLAVPDAHIASVAKQLASTLGDRLQQHTEVLPSAAPSSTAIAFHCSGAYSSALLESLADHGWLTASAHCILSFASRTKALGQFAGTACALEGVAQATTQLHSLFTAIGGQCFAIQPEAKLLYHAAAVFATNFVPVLQAVAEDAWLASGVPSELIAELRHKLLTHAVNNIAELGAKAALTGPAARGDTALIARQSATIHAWDSQASAAYDALSALALRMAHPDKPAVPD